MDMLLPLEESDERSMLEDLQLAAELGKTLLDRNKELELCIKQQGGVIEDQTQEIEYLTKQTAALREVNDSRLRIYEQLEVSIQDLERANQRLLLESGSDKKHIKSLCATIEALESRCDELQAAVQQLQARHCDKQDQAVQHRTDLPQVSDVEQLQAQLQDLRQQRGRDTGKLALLEEQLSTALQENTLLEDQVSLLKLKQQEGLAGDSLRPAYLCSRCLKKVTLEEDAVSVASSDAQRSALIHTWDSQDEDASVDIAYQTLVEKYEALLKMQQASPVKHDSHSAVGDNCMSLQDELRLSGDYNSFNSKTDGLEHQESTVKTNIYTKNKVHKAFSGTPTEFSEAETCSSGFSDDTSSKATQTDSYLPGYFLCSVAEGDDCRISIYDDINPVESRFRKTPEYKQLFREIFTVLKRAAEEKTECEQAAAAAAIAASQTVAEVAPPSEPLIAPVADTPKPKNDILEYLMSGSGHKKSRSRKNSPAKGARSVEKVELAEGVAAVGSNVARLQAGGNRQGGRRRRETRVYENQNFARDRSLQKVESWNFQPQPFVSAASQEVAKLRRLEKSYAEVLRLGPKKPLVARAPFPGAYRC